VPSGTWPYYCFVVTAASSQQADEREHRFDCDWVFFDLFRSSDNPGFAASFWGGHARFSLVYGREPKR
jgi:hypothetical protein